MRGNYSRHFPPPPEPAPRKRLAAIKEAKAEPLELPPEMSWHDYAVFLLHLAAEVEHALLAQYLYAAYSLGGAKLGSEVHEQARDWREVILGIAKEEMGHLITVQNMLRVIGGPLHLDREDYPFNSDFYPFEFRLEPLTKDSLAKYIVAEAPEEWDSTPEAKEIIKRATEAAGKPVVHVGKLYGDLVKLFENRGALTDDDFRDDTLPYQASWAEWGRGYEGGERGNVAGRKAEQAPNVLVMATPDRAGVIGALKAIARQGEAPTLDRDSPGEESHFKRFLAIYQDFPNNNPPSRDIPVNPTTDQNAAKPCNVIRNPRSLLWAHLFNVRYRKLLFTLKHAIHVEAGASMDRPTARGNLISWAFGEMYNLRSIAGILVVEPLDDPDKKPRAAPTFEIPYTLDLPDWDSDKWRVQRDFINASETLIHDLVGPTGGKGPQYEYLRALRDHDKLALPLIETLLRNLEAQEANA